MEKNSYFHLLFGIIFTNYFNQIGKSQILLSVKYVLNISYTLVGTGRFELPTSRLSVVRSNQLSYAPVAVENHFSLIGRNSLGSGKQ